MIECKRLKYLDERNNWTLVRNCGPDCCRAEAKLIGDCRSSFGHLLVCCPSLQYRNRLQSLTERATWTEPGSSWQSSWWGSNCCANALYILFLMTSNTILLCVILSCVTFVSCAIFSLSALPKVPNMNLKFLSCFGTDKPPPRSKSSNAELLPNVDWDWLTLAPLVVGTEINDLFGFCLCLPLSRRWLASASCVLKFCLHGSNLTPTPLELPPAFATTWRSGLVATGPSGHVVTDSVSILNLVNSENKGWPWLFVNYSKKTGLHTSTSCILFRSNPRMNN